MGGNLDRTNLRTTCFGAAIGADVDADVVVTLDLESGKLGPETFLFKLIKISSEYKLVWSSFSSFFRWILVFLSWSICFLKTYLPTSAK